MDKIERDRLRALCEAATAGPWISTLNHDHPTSPPQIDLPHESGLASMMWMCHAPTEEAEDRMVAQTERDCEFIAAARTALPAALDALDAMEAELRAVENLNEQTAAERDDLRAKLDAAEAAIADAAKPLLAESDLIEFYKARMVEHRNNAIASRKRAERAEAEMVAKAEYLADSIAKAVDESADRRISELEAKLATIRRAMEGEVVDG